MTTRPFVPFWIHAEPLKRNEYSLLAVCEEAHEACKPTSTTSFKRKSTLFVTLEDRVRNWIYSGDQYSTAVRYLTQEAWVELGEAIWEEMGKPG